MTANDLRSIMQILVPVTDVDRAADFYEHVLGLPLVFKFPGTAFFDADGTRIYLAKPTEADFDGRATIYFRVDDVGASLDRLEAAGAHVRERQSGLFHFCQSGRKAFTSLIEPCHSGALRAERM